MDIREKELLELRSFTQNIETEVTMLLQSLQWDRKRILEGSSTSTCQYDVNHTIPTDNLSTHENSCILRSLGYVNNEELLPNPPDDNAHTLVKFSNIEIEKIINEASKNDPLFKKGSGGVSHQPLSLSRLQLVFTADERRAIHDAVVAAVPSCHDLEDLALAGSTEDAKPGRSGKSRLEILAELRNMKRRRAKYRVAPKTKNYSDVLRDVIRTQMESYTEAISSTTVKEENSDYDRFKSSSDTANHVSRNSGGVRSRDHSEQRLENSAENRQSNHYREGRNRESRREHSSKRFESEDRSDSRKRNESHRHRHQKDEKYNETYKGTSAHSDRERHGGHTHRRHDRQVDTGRSEDKTGGRYNNKYSKHETDNRKSKDINESDRKYERRRQEDRFIMQKIKVEPEEDSRNDKYERRKSDRSSKDRYESRKRKHRDDEYGRQSDDINYKRYYEIKKEPF